MKRILLTFLFVALALPAYAQSSTTFFADLLVWRVREGSADNWAQSITAPGTTQNTNLYNAPFKWNEGFRIGSGYTAPKASWDTLLYWTSYQTKATSNASGRIFSAYLGNFFANNTNGSSFGPHYGSASLLWRFNYNTVDIQLGRGFNIDSVLKLHPFIGIKSAVINQSINTSWRNPSTTVSNVDTPITTFSTASETLKNNFWGIGPSLGLETTWPLYQSSKNSLSILGNFIVALLYGHWSFQDYYQNNTPVTISIQESDINGAAPMTGAFLGFEWETHLRHSSFKAKLGYEAQVWFDQVRYYSYNMGRLNNLMSMQGGSFSLAYQF